jgi:hypothetical protein
MNITLDLLIKIDKSELETPVETPKEYIEELRNKTAEEDTRTATQVRVKKQGRYLLNNITVICEVSEQEKAAADEPGRKSYRKQRKIERGELTFEDKQQKFFLEYGKKNPMQVVDKVGDVEEDLLEEQKGVNVNVNVKEEDPRSHGWWTQSQKKVGKKVPVLYQGKTLEKNAYGFNLGYKQLHQKNLEKKTLKGLPVWSTWIGANYRGKVQYASLGGWLSLSGDVHKQPIEENWNKESQGAPRVQTQKIRKKELNQLVQKEKERDTEKKTGQGRVAGAPAIIIYHKTYNRKTPKPLGDNSQFGVEGTNISWKRWETKVHDYGTSLLSSILRPEALEVYTLTQFKELLKNVQKPANIHLLLNKRPGMCKKTLRKLGEWQEKYQELKNSQLAFEKYVKTTLELGNIDSNLINGTSPSDKAVGSLTQVKLLKKKEEIERFEHKIQTTLIIGQEKVNKPKESIKIKNYFKRWAWLYGGEKYNQKIKSRVLNLYGINIVYGWQPKETSGLYWNKITGSVVLQGEELFGYSNDLIMFGTNRHGQAEAARLESQKPQTLLDYLGIKHKASNLCMGWNPKLQKSLTSFRKDNETEVQVQRKLRKAYGKHKNLGYSVVLNERFKYWHTLPTCTSLKKETYLLTILDPLYKEKNIYSPGHKQTNIRHSVFAMLNKLYFNHRVRSLKNRDFSRKYQINAYIKELLHKRGYLKSWFRVLKKKNLYSSFLKKQLKNKLALTKSKEEKKKLKKIYRSKVQTKVKLKLRKFQGLLKTPKSRKVIINNRGILSRLTYREDILDNKQLTLKSKLFNQDFNFYSRKTILSGKSKKLKLTKKDIYRLEIKKAQKKQSITIKQLGLYNHMEANILPVMFKINYQPYLAGFSTNSIKYTTQQENTLQKQTFRNTQKNKNLTT